MLFFTGNLQPEDKIIADVLLKSVQKSLHWEQLLQELSLRHRLIIILFGLGVPLVGVVVEARGRELVQDSLLVGDLLVQGLYFVRHDGHLL